MRRGWGGVGGRGGRDERASERTSHVYTFVFVGEKIRQWLCSTNSDCRENERGHGMAWHGGKIYRTVVEYASSSYIISSLMRSDFFNKAISACIRLPRIFQGRVGMPQSRA